MKLRPVLIALPAFLLAACDSGGSSTADDDRTASGEVLEGTIGDDMLPLATTSSQPPPLAPEPRTGGEQAAAEEEEEQVELPREQPGDAPLIMVEEADD